VTKVSKVSRKYRIKRITPGCHNSAARTRAGATLGCQAETTSRMDTRGTERGDGMIAGAGGASGGASGEELGGHPPSNAGWAWQILPATHLDPVS